MSQQVRSARLLLLLLLGLGVAVVSCVQSVGEPTHRHGGTASANEFTDLEDVETDSNPEACRRTNCRSMETWERDELSAEASNGIAWASATSNGECLLRYLQLASKISEGKVYVMRLQPVPNAQGVTNQNTPNELYIWHERWSTPTGLRNTGLHEAEHSLRGPRPSSIDAGTWEADVQTVADLCSFI